MEPSHETSATGDLVVGGWTVQPTLNRLCRGDRQVRVEPKLMDVFLHLARRAGQVVSKDEIAATVWPGVFLSDSVISRAIAGLRRALGDDARSPRYIETIAKRGYRLLVPVETPAPVGDPGPTGLPARAATSAPGRVAPGYVVGQWVRGARFYGRGAEIAEILEGPRNGVWLLGGRAIGKTSLLKHLEHLTATEPDGHYVPLFWDLQGCVEPEDLHQDFQAALEDAADRLESLGVVIDEVRADDFLVALGRLRRALRARGRTLLLLWDEVEELIHLHASWPPLLRKLRRALQSQEGVRAVIASGPRLWQLADQRDDTSPFLHGFAPPLYLGPLSEDDSFDLVRQTQAGAGERIDDRRRAREIVRRTGGHPNLLQMLAARTLELGDLERATEAVAADPTVRFLLAVDLDLLTEAERRILRALARSEDVEPVDLSDLDLALPALELGPRLAHLEGLGLVRRDGSRVGLAQPLFHRYLREQR